MKIQIGFSMVLVSLGLIASPLIASAEETSESLPLTNIFNVPVGADSFVENDNKTVVVTR